MRRARHGLLLAAWLAAACGPADQSETHLGSLPDVTVYESEVHPYLERRCATLDCHGDPGRPLRLYAETGLRALGRDRDLPLDAEELAANVASIAGVDPVTDPDRDVMLLKPLAIDAGGMHHIGGDDIWADRSDPGYVCVREWLAGNPPGDACTRALLALPAPPAP